jgi:hypothetical protein
MTAVKTPRVSTSHNSEKETTNIPYIKHPEQNITLLTAIIELEKVVGKKFKLKITHQT